MSAITTSVLLLVGFAALCVSAPVPTFKKASSNKVIVDDEERLSQEERERIVAGLILQIARDFDEGFITQDELEGRSSLRQDDVSSRKAKEELVPVAGETNTDETPFKKM